MVHIPRKLEFRDRKDVVLMLTTHSYKSRKQDGHYTVPGSLHIRAQTCPGGRCTVLFVQIINAAKHRPGWIVNSVMHSFHSLNANSGLSRSLRLSDLKFHLQGGVSGDLVGRGPGISEL